MSPWKMAWIEFQQSRLQAISLALFSLLLGFFLILGLKVQERIKELVAPVDWKADLAIIPKGMTLNDLQKELQSGKTTHFLPEAIYETTKGLAQDQLQLSAVLALTDAAGSRVQYLGEKGLGFQWLKNQIPVEPWREQNVYSTPEWGNRVITAFFAKGSPAAIVRLQELIDRKTVAQAIPIQSSQEKSIEFQASLSMLFWIAGLIFSGLVLFGISTSALWLSSRLRSSFLYLSEIGFPSLQKKILLAILFAHLVVIPLLLGIGIGQILCS